MVAIVDTAAGDPVRERDARGAARPAAVARSRPVASRSCVRRVDGRVARARRPRRRATVPARRPRPARRAGRRADGIGAPRAAAVARARGQPSSIGGAVVVSRPSRRRRAITVLDVGQGDAILVEGSRGGRLLIDGGPDPTRLLVDLDRRIPPWDRRIDAVILTHPHEDHVAGLARLLDRYRVRRVFEPGMRGPGPGYAAWLSRLDDRRRAGPARARARRPADGRRDRRFACCGRSAGRSRPNRPMPGPGSTTSRSCCSAPSGPYRFLLAGDVEQAIDPSLLEPRPPAARLPEGRASRQQDGDDAGVRGRRAAEGGGRLGRRREPVRAPGPCDARPARRRGRPCLPDRPRRHGRGDVRVPRG